MPRVIIHVNTTLSPQITELFESLSFKADAAIVPSTLHDTLHVKLSEQLTLEISFQPGASSVGENSTPKRVIHSDHVEFFDCVLKTIPENVNPQTVHHELLTKKLLVDGTILKQVR